MVSKHQLHPQESTAETVLSEASRETKPLISSYRCTIERVLTGCIAVWFGNLTAKDCRLLQRTVKQQQKSLAQNYHHFLTYTPLAAIGKPKKIIKDTSHPADVLFSLLPSKKKKNKIIKSHTIRLSNNLLPQSVRLLNS